MNEITSLKPIKPNRFVWHVTVKSLEIDLSIAYEGLIAYFRGSVFAHNGLADFYDMYNIVFFETGNVSHLPDVAGAVCSVFSYWRIDTSLLPFDWYIDPLMENDHKVCHHGAKAHNFICTPNNIPPHALKLFDFNYKNYWRGCYIKKGNGVVHVKPFRTDFDGLVPEKEWVNNYKDWRIRNVQANVA